MRQEKNWRQTMDDYLKNGTVDKNKSVEYAANIFNARFGDGNPFIFNGNIINDGCITNLPKETCVEIPMIADRFGMKKTYVGDLPSHLATFIGTTAGIENMVVEAIMEKNTLYGVIMTSR